MKVFGVTGWKNTGKTGLMERLVTEFTERGFRVSTIKHTHHNVDLDPAGTDSHRHRVAGAQEVMLASDCRFALMRENHGNALDLNELLLRMSPVDLVLVEGFKSQSHSKIECHRAETKQPLIAPTNETIVAIASDSEIESGLPCLVLDDTHAIANFIQSHCDLKAPKEII